MMLNTKQSARNLIEAYAADLRPHMLDLSAPAPQPAAPHAADLAYATPGGGEAMRRAVAARYRTLGPDDILITAGAGEALAVVALACAALDIAVEADRGTYPSLTELSTLLRPGDGRGGHARVLTNPSVPDGIRVDLPAAIATSRDRGAFVVADEVYRHIAMHGEVPDAAADLDEAAVSIDDLSKPLGLGGLRIGWIATRNRALLAEARRWLALLSGGPAVPSEALALDALATFDATVAMHRARVRRNADAVYTALDDAGWRCRRADLGVTVAAYPPQALTSDQSRSLHAAGYFLLDASLLGLPGAVRVSLLTPPETLRQAITIASSPPPPATPSRAPRAVVVLMRVPRPGFGKSRLAATIGAERAHDLASAFLADTLTTTTAGDWRRVVAFTPSGARAAAHSLAPDTTAIAQPDGDLGTRIIAALEAGLREADRVVLVGSDTPDLPVELIDAAFAALETHDAVLGPAHDGGFTLVGVRAIDRAMFAGIEWSTASVLARTHAAFVRLGWTVAEVAPWADIDDEASLRALDERTRASGRAPHTRAVLNRLAIGNSR